MSEPLATRVLGQCPLGGPEHLFQQAMTKMFIENPTTMTTLTHYEIQIFCTKCGTNSKLNELKVEMKNV